MTPKERANQVLLQFSFEGKQVIGEAEFLTVREIELAKAYLALESRIQKLEAVAEAAKAKEIRFNESYCTRQECEQMTSAWSKLDKALAELERE